MAFSMDESKRLAEQASDEIEQWLKKFNNVTDVINVEDSKKYQERDIDLIFKTNKRKYEVEIKGDTHGDTGNFFFETVSNTSKDSPGCFMYTEADLMFYYFLPTKVLYVLPIPRTRKWFKKHMEKFKTITVSTRVNNDFYDTKGKLVDIPRVINEVEGIRKYKVK